MKLSVLLSLLLMLLPLHAMPESLAKLATHSWYAGQVNCEQTDAPALEVFELQADTFILRQNKCLHYEAPFLYLMMGSKRALLLDTGAISSQQLMPLGKTVQRLMKQFYGDLAVELIVLHSHNHDDHTAGDQQFIRPISPQITTKVIPATQIQLAHTFNLGAWPLSAGTVSLGGRTLTIIPTPGHQAAAISVYDPHTKLLLTGDTFYPGRLYVRDWSAFLASIERLVTFTTLHPIAAILGAHIELNQQGQEYSVGSLYHHQEAVLPLYPDDLKALWLALKQHSHPTDIKLSAFRVVPLTTP